MGPDPARTFSVVSHGDTRFRERLLPGTSALVVLLTFITMLAVAYGAAFGALLGWLVFLSLTVIAGWVSVVRSPITEVTDTDLHAGRATLPRRHIGAITVLSPADVRDQRRGDARTFVHLRSWAVGPALHLEVVDPDDPHPAWIIASRRPLDLAQALQRSSTPTGE
jgi:hypothetical protein